MLIQIKKKSDGSATLSCRRGDETISWQRQEGLQGQFFPWHDLTHYAVETVLGREGSFYGLVADGWEFADFRKPYPKGPLSPEALATEVLVGLLDQERGAGLRWSTTEFNRSLESYFAATGVPAGCLITDQDSMRIREARAKRFAEWEALEPGSTLELTFPSW